MATTTPDSIYYPTATDSIAPLETVFATLASSVQTALTTTRSIKSYRWANTAARNAQAGMARNDRGYQADNDTLYTYNGSSWVADDTGWLSIPNQTGNYTFDNNAAYRRIGKVVYFRGQLTKKSGNIGSGDGLFTMTAGTRPANITYFNAAATSSGPIRLSMTPGGLMTVAGGPGDASSYVMLDTLSYVADQ